MKNLLKIYIGMVVFVGVLYSQKQKYEYIPKLGDLGYGVKVSIEKERELFKMDIHPVTPKEGIMTGHVILYGHHIKPPYKLEIVNDTLLFLNGVQISPPLQPKAVRYRDSVFHESVKEKFAWKEDYIKHTNEMVKKIHEIYRRVAKKENYNLKIAMDSVLEFLKKDEWVKEGKIEIFGVDTVNYTSIGVREVYSNEKQIEFMVCFSPYESPKYTKEERIRFRRQSLEGMKRRIEKILREGKVYPFEI
jgi:hypothetical protein